MVFRQQNLRGSSPRVHTSDSTVVMGPRRDSTVAKTGMVQGQVLGLANLMHWNDS